MNLPPLVAVADDDPIMRRICDLQLRQAGLRVAVFPTGRDLLEAWARLRPAALILDFELPDFDGTQILRRLRADPAGAAVPVVCITGHAFGDVAERLKAAGATRVFSKPFSPALLVRTIRELIVPAA